MFTPLKKMLPEWQKRTGVTARLGVLAVFPVLAAAILPEAQIAAAKPVRLQGGRLTIACRNSAVAALLRARETEILQDLRSRCPNEPVERIGFILSTWR